MKNVEVNICEMLVAGLKQEAIYQPSVQPWLRAGPETVALRMGGFWRAESECNCKLGSPQDHSHF